MPYLEPLHKFLTLRCNSGCVQYRRSINKRLHNTKLYSQMQNVTRRTGEFHTFSCILKTCRVSSVTNVDKHLNVRLLLQWLRRLILSISMLKTGDDYEAYTIGKPEPLLYFALSSGGFSDPAVVHNPTLYICM